MKYSTVFKGISWLFLSTIASQVISLLTLPYISRAYSESSLSVMGIMASALVLLTILSTLRMEFYIVKKNDNENKEFIPSLYLMSILSGIFLSPFLLIFFNYKNIEVSIHTALLIISYTILSFILNISLLNLTNKKKFATQASIRVVKAITLLTSLWLLSSFEATGVILSLVISTSIPLIWYITKNHSEFTTVFSEFNNKKSIILLQLKTSYHAAIQAVLNVINIQFISFYVIIFGSSNLIAAYFFMERIVTAPLNLIASSLRQVIYKDLVEQKEYNNLLKRLSIYHVSLLLISLLVAAGFYLYGETLINFTLGDGWGLVYQLAVVYMPVLLCRIINIPTTSMYLTLDAMHKLSKYEKIDLITKIIISTIIYFLSPDFIVFMSIICLYICIYYVAINVILYIELFSMRNKNAQ
ncbi:lipopolysaccharide biosynthesis protein [Aliivibrio kagoshimensis]|uniref:lipopolysaccharide biosynthesis protein n=1 Tax=Aliivibrio kagoshimensis TaxID=2910230 RepID=UPI003D105D42